MSWFEGFWERLSSWKTTTNWLQKALSLFLAVLIWVIVNQSLVTTKNFSNVSVRVLNIPAGKTVVGMKQNGLLEKKVSLTLVGNKSMLDELSGNDFEILIDANGRTGEWIATIHRRNLSTLNPNFDLTKGISKVSPVNVIVQLTKLVAEKLPVYITPPVGDAPEGYQYLDVWPYQLFLDVSGPESIMKHLKTKGLRLTFDLANLSKGQLDALQAKTHSTKGEEVSFLVPDAWKTLSIPLLSDGPIKINDPRVNDLRIDFVRISLLPIQSKIPLQLYFPTATLDKFNPQNISWGKTSLIEEKDGVVYFKDPLFVLGSSHTFLQVVESMIACTVTVNPNAANELNWELQFINPKALEDRYIAHMMSDMSEEQMRPLQPLQKEEYLRNRFRTYMRNFQLVKDNDTRFNFSLHLEKNAIIFNQGDRPLPYHQMFRDRGAEE